ncbi:MAG: type II toxin-antitoxin system VapC family toxin [Gemmatirosa sp.]|nr:type II toxin-antitoxin system VapC family toxin [Gemmatirosa sp.]
MINLLDTSIAVAVLRGTPPIVHDRLREAVATGARLHVSSIVLYELWHGVARSDRTQFNASRVQTFLAGDLGVLPFDEDDAATAGAIRAALERAGTPIGPYDLLIAAQALRRRITLVTANVSEFARVPGLSWEDWTR